MAAMTASVQLQAAQRLRINDLTKTLTRGSSSVGRACPSMNGMPYSRSPRIPRRRAPLLHGARARVLSTPRSCCPVPPAQADRADDLAAQGDRRGAEGGQVSGPGGRRAPRPRIRLGRHLRQLRFDRFECRGRHGLAFDVSGVKSRCRRHRAHRLGAPPVHDGHWSSPSRALALCAPPARRLRQLEAHLYQFWVSPLRRASGRRKTRFTSGEREAPRRPFENGPARLEDMGRGGHCGAPAPRSAR